MDRSHKLFELAARRSKPQTRSNTFAEAPILPPTLPIEIIERTIDYLHTDKNALIACSVVCRAWFPTSRWHLYTHVVPVIPVKLGQSCAKVNTAVVLEGGSVLYGSNKGVYLSRDGTLNRVLKLPAVSQIDVLADQELLFVLSRRRLHVVPLRFVTGPLDPNRRLSVLASDVTFFKVGKHAGSSVICIVKSHRFSAHFEVMEVTTLEQGDEYGLRPFRSFYLPDRVRSVHIGNKMIGAAVRTGFQCVDPLSLVTFPLPVVPLVPEPVLDAKKCRAMFRVEERFLLCYDCCAFYMDKAGTSFEHAFAIRWSEPAKDFALAAPYLLSFTAGGMHVWRIDTGVHVQTVHGAGIRLLSSEPRVVVKLGDGRVLGLDCQK
ncbi:CNH domain-containing protein [Roridomyces roridus]|uniref:CNH domain-containing protein n=1 Tax=Roridomyces roridus TaxID=1738132 RepID=A0AAD7BMQ4_9AGAR|nr:CNH domain-containing protein [Roridomyces roridus]